MADPTDEDQVAQAFNDKLAEYVLNGLQLAMNEGNFGEAKMIMAALTIVEVMDVQGNSRLQLIMTDTRLTLNMGLNNYARLALEHMS